MTHIAVLVGNTHYKNLASLECCAADVMAIRELLVATDKYTELQVIENTEANTLKSRLRDALSGALSAKEIFFYFTGHGYQLESEFFFCATNFDSRRPNETGISTTDLHTLLRDANAELIVKVIDACNSGTLLVKAESVFIPYKNGFNDLVQIASCLDSQNSLTGDPLSVFTERFRAAALRKCEGSIYYTDLIDSLRDDFRENNSQTPHFVAQGTARALFVDNAKRLDGLRARVNPVEPKIESCDMRDEPSDTTTPATLVDVFSVAEAKLANHEIVSSFVGSLFDELIAKLSKQEFADFFELEVKEHSDFHEPTARAFIIRILSQENRPDNFVTANITREAGQRYPWGVTASVLGLFAYDDKRLSETYDLELNCTMARAQLTVSLTPKYSAIKRIVLVVTCAPSLEHCYVFEIGTLHALRDFGQYDIEGSEVVRRWYKFGWSDSTNALVTKIANKLDDVVRSHLEDVASRLGEDGAER